MRCLSCGSEISDTASFCNQCGAAVEKREEPVKVEIQEDVSEKEKKNKKGSKRSFYIIIIVIIITVGALFGMKILNGKEDNSMDVSVEVQDQLEEKEPLQNQDTGVWDVIDETTDEIESQENEVEEIEEEQYNPESSIIDIDVESEVVLIREKYNEIVSNMNEGIYSEYSLRDGVVAYYDDSKLHAVTISKGINGSSYSKFYYYADNELIFAYHEGSDAHRFYFYNEKLMRWRYSKNAEEPQDAYNLDMVQAEEYLNMERMVLEESNLLKNEMKDKLSVSQGTVNIINIVATSTLSEYDMTHSPDRVLDKDIATAWVEGVEGQGVGESLTFYFDKEYMVNGININAGYQKNADVYAKNSRPAEIKVSFSNGASQNYVLQDVNGIQEIILEEPVYTEYITFTIESVYEGNRYEDTVISEISIY